MTAQTQPTAMATKKGLSPTVVIWVLLALHEAVSHPYPIVYEHARRCLLVLVIAMIFPVVIYFVAAKVVVWVSVAVAYIAPGIMYQTMRPVARR